jgi:MFS family permease
VSSRRVQDAVIYPRVDTGPIDVTTIPNRASIQRKTLYILMLSQTMGSAGVSIAVTEGGPIMRELTGNSRLAGSASAAATFGGALAGLLISGLMKRQGRRAGLMRGYLTAMVGSAIVVYGAHNRMTLLFLFGVLIFGVGQGTNLLTRYAAADLALPDEKGQAISFLLFGSTFGAVGAQFMVPFCERMAEKVNLWKYTGPFIFAGFLLLIASLNVFYRLKPDPLVLAGGVFDDGKRGIRLPPVGRAFRIISRSRRAMLGLFAMGLSQAAMVAIMTMTPVHMNEHKNTISLRGPVIALHVVGMYLFAPIVGRLVDKWGRLQVIISGALILIAATAVSALAGHNSALLFLGLYLLGLGWSGGMIGGTALMNESVPAGDRVIVQGSADLFMSVCGGIAGFSSGFIKQAVGYHQLSWLGMGLGLALALGALSQFRRGVSVAGAAA